MSMPATTPRITATTRTIMVPVEFAIQPKAKQRETVMPITKMATREAVTYGNHYWPKRAMIGPAIM